MMELEKKLLGLLLLDAELYFLHYDKLFNNLFTNHIYKAIFNAIAEISKENGIVDSVSISQKVKGDNVFTEVQALEYQELYNVDINNVITAITEEYRKRELTKLGSVLAHSNERKSEDTIEAITKTVGNLTTSNAEIVEFGDVIDGLVHHMKNKKEGLTGIETGMRQYDNHAKGLQPEDLIVVAGETSQGKTSFAISMIHKPLMDLVPVLFISLEMSQNQLASRLLSNESGISSKDLMYGDLNTEQMQDIETKLNNIKDIPFYIDDTGSSDYQTIVNTIKKYHLQRQIKIVVIDYIQLLNNRTKGGTKEQEVGDIIRGLKNLAKELKITMIGLSQLSRNKENPIPTLSRLRQSGQIEEAADQVLLIFRPSYYGIAEYEFDGHSVPTDGNGFIFLAKGRNVGTSEFIMRFDAPLTKWIDDSGAYEDRDENPF